MARKGKWLNEEMWREAVRWRIGGLTYGEICGQLAKHATRFGLKDIPSDDTVRREVTKRLAREASALDTDGGDAITRHTQLLRELIQNWAEQLHFRKPEEVLRWYWQDELPKALRVHATSTREARDSARAAAFAHTPANLGDLWAREVEKDALFPYLRDHLGGQPVAEEYERWKSYHASYTESFSSWWEPLGHSYWTRYRLEQCWKLPELETKLTLVRLAIVQGCDLLLLGLQELQPRDQKVVFSVSTLEKLRSDVLLGSPPPMKPCPVLKDLRFAALGSSLWKDAEDKSGVVALTRRLLAQMQHVEEVEEKLIEELVLLAGQDPLPGSCRLCA